MAKTEATVSNVPQDVQETVNMFVDQYGVDLINEAVANKCEAILAEENAKYEKVRKTLRSLRPKVGRPAAS